MREIHSVLNSALKMDAQLRKSRVTNALYISKMKEGGFLVINTILIALLQGFEDMQRKRNNFNK